MFTNNVFTKSSWAHVVKSFIQLCFTKWKVDYAWASRRCSVIPNHDTITCYQWTCLPVECSKQVFLEHFVVPVPARLKCVAGIKFRISIYLQTWNMLMRYNIRCTVSVLLYVKKDYEVISFCFIYVLHSMPTFLWNQSCTVSLHWSCGNSHLKLDTPTVPPDFRDGETPENVSLVLSQSTSLVCDVTGSPTPVVTWYKDGTPVSELSLNKLLTHIPYKRFYNCKK